MSAGMLTITFAEATVEQLRQALDDADAHARTCDEQGLTHTWHSRAEEIDAELSRRSVDGRGPGSVTSDG